MKPLFVSGLIISIFCASVLPSKANDQQNFAYARKLMDQGHFQEACRILLAVQKRHPKEPYVLCELGNCFEQSMGDIPNSLTIAQKYFEQALKLDPECGAAYVGLAKCADSRGDYKLGVTLTTKSISAKKPSNEGLVERAGALSNLKRDKEALADIELFIKKTNIKDHDTLLQKATILENLKKYDQALTVYRGMLRTDYEDSIVFREIACLEALHKPEEAVASISKLIKRNKQDDSSYLARARLYERMGKHKEALADFSEAIDLQPSTTALKERAAVYDKIGRKDLAEKDRKDADRI